MSKAAWGEVLAWTKAEIETGRTALETVTGDYAIRIQTRIAVMRDLQKYTETPKPADLPPSVPYE